MADMMETTPQHDIEASLLTIIMHRWPVATKILDLREDIFADSNHRILFRLFNKIQKERGSWDENLLRSAFEEMGGDSPAYTYVKDIPHNPNNADLYISSAIKSAKERKLLKYFSDAHQNNEDPIETLKKAMIDLEELEGMRQPRMRGAGIDEVARNYLEREYIQPLTTGFPTLDGLIGGIRPEEMTVIGAPPGAGKSSLAASVALNNAVAGSVSAYFSKEMLEERIFSRLLACVSETRVGLWEDFRSGKVRTLDKVVEDNLRASMDILATNGDSLCFFDLQDSATINPRVILEEVQARNHSFKEKEDGRHVDLVVVDYLQILDFDQGKNSLATAIGDLSQELRGIALREHCHILVLAAVNRSMGKSLQLESFRDSSGIDFNADNAIMMVNKHDMSDLSALGDGWGGENSLWQPLVLRAAKVRNGQTGKMGYMKFCGAQQRFDEMTHEEKNAFVGLLKDEGSAGAKYG